jgi:excisionase family DNA binding protein
MNSLADKHTSSISDLTRVGQQEPSRQLLDVEDVKRDVPEFASFTTAEIYRYAREGILPCVRFGRKIKFRRVDLERFLEQGGKGFDGGWRKAA